MKKITILLLLSSFLFSYAGQKHDKKLNNDWAAMNLRGKVKSIIETNYPSTRVNGKLQKGKAGNKKTYTFNPKGNLIAIFGDASMAEGSWGKQEFKYDEKGWKTECVIYNTDSSIQGRSIYKHDTDGNIIEENIYSQSYPKKGEVIYQGKGITKYNKDGYKIEKIKYSKDGIQGSMTTYKYDARGNLTEEKRGNRLITYKYDAHGNIIEINLEGPTKYIYTYDKSGNWIQQVNDLGGSKWPVIIGREIAYY